MQDLTNEDIVELLMRLSEKFDCRNVNEIMNELEVGEQFFEAK